MKKILDRFVTGFFITALGIAWYCSTKFYIKPDRHSIVIYDVFGKETKLEGLRVDFKTQCCTELHF